MKFCFYTALFTNVFLAPAMAAELSAQSKIDSVVVYPHGAEISRLIQLDVAQGDHTLQIGDLPADTDVQSIRLESIDGKEILVHSVNSSFMLNKDADGQSDRRKEILIEAEKIQDEQFLLKQQSENITFRRKLIRDTAQRPLAVKSSVPNETKLVIEDDLGGLFDLIEKRLNAIEEEELRNKQAMRLAARKFQDINFELQRRSPKQTSQLIVAAEITSPADQAAAFKITYRISNASWMPFYDARLNEDEKEEKADLTLIRHASIIQDTKENWEGVSLTLATSLPSGSMVAPTIDPLETTNHSESRDYVTKRMRPKKKVQSLKKSELQSATAPAQGEAEVRFNDFIKIEGRLTIKNDGVSKKIHIADQTVPATVVSRAVPIFDLNAYRTAKFKPVGNSPLLPGRVRLFRGNLFVGESVLPMLVPGQKYDLGFGVDARVQISRNVVKKSKRETGILTTQDVDERSWITTVQNLHSNPVNVEIFDRVPYSTVEGEEISVLSGTTSVTKKNVDNKRGVLLWERKIAPAKTDTIRFGYQMVIPR